VVIQHPGDGNADRLYWPATTEDVLCRNTGHHIALSSSTSPVLDLCHAAVTTSDLVSDGSSQIRHFVSAITSIVLFLLILHWIKLNE
jgi:hypothetical protein